MPDTMQSMTNLLANFPASDSIMMDAQDIRNLITSMRPGYGQLYIAEADAATVTLTGSGTFDEVDEPAWTLDGGGYLFDESDGNGQLTYTGAADVMALVVAHISMTAVGDADIMHLRIGVDGTTDAASEVEFLQVLGATRYTATTSLLTPLSQNEYVSLWLANESATDNATALSASIKAITLPV